MLKTCMFFTEMNITYEDTQKSVCINHCALHFGSCQYAALDLLLTRQEVDDTTLSLALYQQEATADNRVRITKHISKLRSKLRMHGLDIKRVYNHSYRLISLVAVSAA